MDNMSWKQEQDYYYNRRLHDDQAYLRHLNLHGRPLSGAPSPLPSEKEKPKSRIAWGIIAVLPFFLGGLLVMLGWGFVGGLLLVFSPLILGMVIACKL